ncbi:hypothetical protein Tco_1494841 [Tanacetum coccineum]
MGWPTIGGKGDGVLNWTSSGVIGERSIEDEEVSLVDGVLEGALGALGDEVWVMEFLCHLGLNWKRIFKKRTQRKPKTYKTKHGMEKKKSNRSQSQSKSKSQQESQPDKV